MPKELGISREFVVHLSSAFSQMLYQASEYYSNRLGAALIEGSENEFKRNYFARLTWRGSFFFSPIRYCRISRLIT